MKGLSVDHPEQDFEWNVSEELGEGLIVAFDHAGYTTAVKYALKNGWDVDCDGNDCAQFGAQRQVRVVKVVGEVDDVIDRINEAIQILEEPEVEEEVIEETEETVEEQTETVSDDSIDFEALAALENDATNREKVADLAKDNGITLNRNKLRSVVKLVAEFEKQYNARNSAD